MGMMGFSDEIRAGLMSGVVIHGDTWTFDLRRVLLNPEFAHLFISLFVEFVEATFPNVHQIVGDGYGSYPLVSGCSVLGSMDGGMIRVDGPKSYGSRSLVEGNIRPEPVILVDDVVNTGTAAMAAVEVLESLEYEVVGFVALAHWGASGLNKLNALGIEAYALLDLNWYLYGREPQKLEI